MLPPPYPHDDPFTNNCKKIMCILKKIRGKGNAKQPKGNNAAFRECFFKIGDVHSLLAQGTPLLALTATATEEIKMDTMKSLGMKPDTYHVSVSPDRPNIYLYKTKVDKNLNQTFQWFLDIQRIDANHTPRTLIYCKSQIAKGLWEVV